MGPWRQGSLIAGGIIGALVALCCAFSVGVLSGSGQLADVVGTPAIRLSMSTVVPRATPTPRTPADPFSDGTHMVGRDVAPGRWQTPGGDGCYWARLKSFAGGDDILASANPRGQAIVEILPTDAGFRTTRCGTWAKID